MSVVGSARIAIAAFATGAVLMLFFDETVTRIAGVALLLSGIALGLFAIATDEFIAGDDGD